MIQAVGAISRSLTNRFTLRKYYSASQALFLSGRVEQSDSSERIRNSGFNTGWARHLSTTKITRLSSEQQQNHQQHDRLLVVGSGVAGSAAALVAAETYQIPVTLIYAGSIPQDCNSNWAQGGIIYRNYDSESGDCAELLAHDIHRAGAGLCKDEAVIKVSEEGPDRVRQLLLNGEPFAEVPFDRNSTGDLSLCLEASHSAPRILHYADHTGMVITKHITKAAARHPLITLQPQTLVTDLIEEDDMCVGVATLDRASGRRRAEFSTRGVVLASGGLAGIYEHSTNPAGFNALGSSVALAVRAGVKTQDLEYVQFHPTSLYIPNEARFLLTEALRGEGAVLRDANGRAFATDFHPDGELAPRDIVARGVFEESQKSDTYHNVFLDISHRDASWLEGRFPTIQAHLMERGLDLTKDRLPIIPAAHYTCGGISTDLEGRTTMKGLYAAGEAARTGLHGGNRLASTSLLEGLVFGAAVADFVGGDVGRELQDAARQRIEKSSPMDMQSPSMSLEPNQIENAAHRSVQLLRQLRRVMWDNVGVVRSPSGLSTALDALGDIRDEASELNNICPTLETSAVRDAAFAGYAVALAASSNKESAGAHYIVQDSEDYSDEEDAVAVR